jgi:hypothetical protein
MRFCIGKSQSLFAHVRVSLCGRSIAMTQQLLDGTRVCAVVLEVRGKRVSQCVWMRSAHNAGALAGFIKKAGNITTTNRLAT